MARKSKQQADPYADRAELRRLVEAAKADHWDDGPRLALADWLEEHGGEAEKARAEVVRLQVDHDAGGPYWGLTLGRLIDSWVREWVGPWREFFSEILPGCERGLLVSKARGRAWKAGGSALPDQAWRWVETVAPASFEPDELPSLAASPRLATVTGLDLSGSRLTVAGLRAALGHGGPAPTLRRLRLGRGRLALRQVLPLVPAGIEEVHLTDFDGDWGPLFEWDHGALRGLDVPNLYVDDDVVGRLAASPLARRLSRLSLISTEMLAPASFAALAVLPLRRLALRRVAYRDGPFGGDGLAFLAASPCAELEELSLYNCAGPAGRPARPPRLRRLSLGSAALDANVIRDLGAGGLFDGLAELDLSHGRFGEEGAAALIDAVGRPPRTLRLRGCRLKDAGAARLSAWPGLAGVRYLDVAYNGIGPAGMRALLGSPHAAKIEALALAGNDGTAPEAVGVLDGSPIGAGLKWLDLSGSSSPAMAAALTGAALPSLREVRLNSYGIPADAMRRLRASLPGCAIGV